MRAVFLSSAYCGYVHTYAYDPAEYEMVAGTTEAAAHEPRERSEAAVEDDRKHHGTILTRLAAWMGRSEERQPC